MKIVVVSGGLRVPSSTRLLADELGRAVSEEVVTRGATAEIENVDLREHAHGIVDAMLTGFATGELAGVLERLAAADALIVVTPVFTAGVSGLTKSFLDIVDPDSLRGMPVLLAATGGTERHSLVLEYALRPLFAYLAAEPVRTGVFAATGDFGTAELSARVARAAGELADRLTAGSTSRVKPADEFDDVVPFSELLRQNGI